LLGAGVGGGILFMKLTAPPPEDNPLAIVIEKNAAAEGEAHAAEGGHEAAKKEGGEKKEAEKKEGGEKKEGEKKEGGDKKEGPPSKPVPVTEKFATTYFEFPGNFTTNLRGSKRFVQVSIGLATQYDKKVIENVQTHEVAIRSEVLALLAEQTEADVIGIDNRKRLQNLLRDVVNRVLTERTDFGGIENVYITALVMQ
jgi:flagellar FliL protein